METKKRNKTTYPTELWDKVRVLWEGGASVTKLANDYDMRVSTIFNHAKRNGWERDSGAEKHLEAAILRYDIETNNEPVPDASDKSDAIISKHQAETEKVRHVLYTGLKRHAEAETIEEKRNAFEDLKAAKISSECLLNIHQAERRAWRIDASDIRRNITIVRDFENKDGMNNANNSTQG